jgi:hypothetical protein
MNCEEIMAPESEVRIDYFLKYHGNPYDIPLFKLLALTEKIQERAGNAWDAYRIISDEKFYRNLRFITQEYQKLKMKHNHVWQKEHTMTNSV